MMCAGLTVWSPLVRANTGPGKKVAIVGIGGLGHFAVMWAAALGAEVYAISHTADKKEDAMSLGAKGFILSNEEKWAEPYAFEFDFVLNSADMTNEFDISKYLSILKVGGQFHQVGLPDEALPEIKAQMFMYVSQEDGRRLCAILCPIHSLTPINIFFQGKRFKHRRLAHRIATRDAGHA